MEKHSVFAGAVMLLVGAIAFQSMRADAVSGASPAQTLQMVSPMELMQNPGNLPAERIDYPY